MNLPGPVQLMQQYNNHQPIYPDFGNPLWFPVRPFCSGLSAAGVCHFIKPRGSLANSFSQNMPTFIIGEDETTNLCNVGNSLNLATGGQEVAVKSFPQQYWPLPHHLTHNPVLVRVDLMTVEQTSAWIRSFSLFHGWDEAEQYSWSFHENRICGRHLGKMTMYTLKYDLGIMKCGHRLEIKEAIEHLFPDALREVTRVENEMMDKYKSSMCESVQGTELKEIGAQPAQISKLHSYYKHKTNQHDLTSSRVRRQPSHISKLGFVSRSSTVLTENRHSNLNSIDKQTNIGNPQTVNLSKTFDSRTATGTSAEVLSFRIRKKSPRARPDNPTKYKALRNARIRAGKSAGTDIVGYLPKGSVVLINQIKGRSGRIIAPEPDGCYLKVGWVTLYTHDRQQLLEKLNYKRKAGYRRLITREK